MKAQTSGKIVNLSSIAGRGLSVSSSSAYAAAKGGIICREVEEAPHDAPVASQQRRVLATTPSHTLLSTPTPIPNRRASATNRLRPTPTSRRCWESSSCLTMQSVPLRSPTHCCSIFLSTTYAAAAEAGGWDRAALECPIGVSGPARAPTDAVIDWRRREGVVVDPLTGNVTLTPS
jgi:hypothetical protein